MDIYHKPTAEPDILANLGPLATLAGRWEGNEGLDIAPARSGPASTNFSELITFDPIGPIINGPQVLYGLKYNTTACPLDEGEPFHEETGYWLWDPDNRQVMRCFMVPRGVTLIAGGPAEKTARQFELTAEIGSETFGILSGPFLHDNFRTVRYELKLEIENNNCFSYQEDTQLQLHGEKDIFHHTDKNRLQRIIG